MGVYLWMIVMTYDIDWLKNKHKNGENLKYIYFWGHTPKHTQKLDVSCFSQWWPANFTVDGILYPTAEHYMMAQKAKLFDDDKIFTEILKSKHPKQAKDLGRRIQNFDYGRWQKHRFDIVTAGNLAKFSQNPDLKAYLLNTGNRILVEASPVDRIWGIGMAKDNPNIHNPHHWQGLNLLGFALMTVRDQLHQDKSNQD